MEAVIATATPDQLADAGTRTRFLATLAADEKSRMTRFHSQETRDLFLLAHGLVRTTLSRCAPVDPAEWRFVSGPHGRPEIAAPRSALRFNLSHTKGLAACAITDGCDVGIDVEHMSRSVATRSLSKRFFSERECADLDELSGEAEHIRFLEYWTLKEAYIKARGLGLAIPLDSFSFYRDRLDRWRITFDDRYEDDPGRWTFRSWRIGGVHQAALALAIALADQEMPAQP
jgi:4'-phosphopantetheinyl transferase